MIFSDNIKGITIPGNYVKISQTFCNNNLYLSRFTYNTPFLLCFSSHSIERVSNLSEDEIADLEGEVIHLIEAGADLVPPSFLVYSCRWGVNI